MHKTGIGSFAALTVVASAATLYAMCGGGHAAASGADQRHDTLKLQDVQAIKQLGTTMGDAMVALDMSRLDRIYADDWGAVAKSEHVMSKRELMKSIISGDHRLLSYELGPIDVQVLGDLAVAHGTVKERRLLEGKQVDMEGVYMDLLKKINGQWVVERSAGRMLEPQT